MAIANDPTPNIESLTAAQATALSNALVTAISQQHVQVPLSAAQIIAMEAAPIGVVAAPGTGLTLVVDRAEFRIVRTSTAFTGGGAAQLQYNNTANNGGVLALDTTLASTVITGGAGTSTSLRNGAVISDVSTIENQGLFFTNGGGAAFAAGTGTALLDVWYYVTGQ